MTILISRPGIVLTAQSLTKCPVTLDDESSLTAIHWQLNSNKQTRLAALSAFLTFLSVNPLIRLADFDLSLFKATLPMPHRFPRRSIRSKTKRTWSVWRALLYLIENVNWCFPVQWHYSTVPLVKSTRRASSNRTESRNRKWKQEEASEHGWFKVVVLTSAMSKNLNGLLRWADKQVGSLYEIMSCILAWFLLFRIPLVP